MVIYTSVSPLLAVDDGKVSGTTLLIEGLRNTFYSLLEMDLCLLWLVQLGYLGATLASNRPVVVAIDESSIEAQHATERQFQEFRPGQDWLADFKFCCVRGLQSKVILPSSSVSSARP